MTNDGAHGFFGDGVDNFVHGGGELFDEVAHKFRNIRFSLAERWQRNRENIQAIVQILSEFTVTDHLPQVLIGRRDDTNIDAATNQDRKSTRLNSSHLGISYAV